MKRKRNPTCKCAVCGEFAAYAITVTKVFGRGNKQILVEDIPAYNCNHCHQQYLDGATMDAIDAIRKNPAAYVQPRTIGAVKMAA